jgi:hypothetical protein
MAFGCVLRALNSSMVKVPHYSVKALDPKYEPRIGCKIVQETELRNQSHINPRSKRCPNAN